MAPRIADWADDDVLSDAASGSFTVELSPCVLQWQLFVLSNSSSSDCDSGYTLQPSATNWQSAGGSTVSLVPDVDIGALIDGHLCQMWTLAR